jgi:LmbE family N-acetylglucosaminyl deacetylase
MASERTSSRLPQWHRVLAVVAHPDDESFGLGAVIDAFHLGGAHVDVLCFTRGEASTLGAADDLGQVRAAELAAAARLLGVGRADLLEYADGALALVERADLAAQVTRRLEGIDGLLVFDDTGITGHPDHQAATAAAVAAGTAAAIPVLAWTLPIEVTERLRIDAGADFRAAATVDIVVRVPRVRQRQACLAHQSQTPPTSVLWRRLELLEDREYLRWLVAP